MFSLFHILTYINTISIMLAYDTPSRFLLFSERLPMVDENNPIPPELEKQIQDYENFLFHPGQTWNISNLEKEVFKYLDRYGHGQYGDSGTLTDKLSSRFANIWQVYYRSNKFLEADKFWDLPLDIYAKWEEDNNKIVARGSPHYFRGMAAVTYGNVDRGFLFFHQALEDDFREGFRPYKKNNRSPAWDFVTFNYSSRRQAALPLIKPRADWLSHRISNYQDSNRGSLSLAKLRRKVLVNTRLRETTFSFTYEVFRSKNLLSYPQAFRTGRFASQLSLDILFSLCRIGEVWLKNKQTPANSFERQLGGQLVRFFTEHDIPVNNNEIREVGKADFEKSLGSLLDNRKGPLPRRFQLVESDLLLIYILRNEAAHAATSSRIISERFNELVERVFFGLFKIVEVLY